VTGGSVIVGESSINSPPDISARLLNSEKRFGNTLESAMYSRSRDPNETVDFAVLSDDGILEDDYGGIPLKARQTGRLFTQNGPIVTVSSTEFQVRKLAITDRAGRPRATILVTRDVELEEEMLHGALLFNIAVAIASFVLCGVILGLEFYEMK
jgi:hypothetical protein